MINDKQRREVAKRLRALPIDLFVVRNEWEKEGYGTVCYDQTDYYQIHYEIMGCFPADNMNLCDCEEFHNSLADLIDRPTCRDVGGVYKFRCSVCGCTIDIFKGDIYGTGDGVMTIGDDFLYSPSFCPSCGAEVLEDA